MNRPMYEMKNVIKEKKNITIDFIYCNKGIPHASDIQTNLLDDLMVLQHLQKKIQLI